MGSGCSSYDDTQVTDSERFTGHMNRGTQLTESPCISMDCYAVPSKRVLSHRPDFTKQCKTIVVLELTIAESPATKSKSRLSSVLGMPTIDWGGLNVLWQFPKLLPMNMWSGSVYVFALLDPSSQLQGKVVMNARLGSERIRIDEPLRRPTDISLSTMQTVIDKLEKEISRHLKVERTAGGNLPVSKLSVEALQKEANVRIILDTDTSGEDTEEQQPKPSPSVKTSQVGSKKSLVVMPHAARKLSPAAGSAVQMEPRPSVTTLQTSGQSPQLVRQGGNRDFDIESQRSRVSSCSISHPNTRSPTSQGWHSWGGNMPESPAAPLTVDFHHCEGEGHGGTSQGRLSRLLPPLVNSQEDLNIRSRSGTPPPLPAIHTGLAEAKLGAHAIDTEGTSEGSVTLDSPGDGSPGLFSTLRDDPDLLLQLNEPHAESDDRWRRTDATRSWVESQMARADDDESDENDDDDGRTNDRTAGFRSDSPNGLNKDNPIDGSVSAKSSQTGRESSDGQGHQEGCPNENRDDSRTTEGAGDKGSPSESLVQIESPDTCPGNPVDEQDESASVVSRQEKTDLPNKGPIKQS